MHPERFKERKPSVLKRLNEKKEIADATSQKKEPAAKIIRNIPDL